MSNEIFPTLPGLTWDQVTSPMFNTLVKRSVSGMEYRSLGMQYPLWTFTLAYDLLRDAKWVPTDTEFQQLSGFYAARQGAFDSFLFSNPNDACVANMPIGTGNGSNALFQLSRLYGSGSGSTFNEPVENVNGNISVYLTDWQGTQLQYTTSRTNQARWSNNLTNAPWGGGGGASFAWEPWPLALAGDGFSTPAFGNSVYVVVRGGTNEAATSGDGITWSVQTTTFNAAGGSGLSFGNGVFCAVSAEQPSNQAATSPDGVTWATRTLSEQANWLTTVFGGSVFLAYAFDSNVAATSPTGITWTTHNLPAEFAVGTWAVTFGNGVFCAFPNGGNVVASSANGTTWSTVSSPAGEDFISDVEFGAGVFCAVSETGNTVYTSPDAVTWTARTLPIDSGDGAWSELAWNGARFCLVTNLGGRSLNSGDGITWEPSALPGSGNWRIASNGTGFVAVDTYSSNVATSNESGVPIPFIWNLIEGVSVAPYAWPAVSYANGVFCAITDTNNAITSSDGVSWAFANMPTTTEWGLLGANSSTFVAVDVSVSDVAATSVDGINWTTQTLSTTADWAAIAFGNSVFCVVSTGSSNVATTSSDGVTWATRALSSAQDWSALSFGNGVFCALGQNSSIASTSPTGVTWTARTLSESLQWSGLAFGAGVFCAVALGTANYATSPDGITWTARTLPLSADWKDVIHDGDYFWVAATDSVQTLYSADGIAWASLFLPGVRTWNKLASDGSGTVVAVPLSSSTDVATLLPAP